METATPADLSGYVYSDEDVFGGDGVRDRVACKVNLIPFNPFAESGLRRSPRERVQAFADVLQGAGIVTTVRRTRGDDIAAACGQLAGEVRDRTSVAQRMARGTIALVRADSARH